MGGEVGTSTSVGLLTTDESSFSPFAANAKRAFAVNRHFTIDAGGGLSLGRASYRDDSLFGSDEAVEVSDRVVGGQVFGTAMLRAGRALLGLQAKYQLTSDASEVSDRIGSEKGWDYSNLKIGLVIGVSDDR